jgi:hypothetical protein
MSDPYKNTQSLELTDSNDITMQLDSSSYIWNRLIVYNRAFIHVAVGDFDKTHYIPELLPYSITISVDQHVRGKTITANDISINFMNWLKRHNAYVQITRLLTKEVYIYRFNKDLRLLFRLTWI